MPTQIPMIAPVPRFPSRLPKVSIISGVCVAWKNSNGIGVVKVAAYIELEVVAVDVDKMAAKLSARGKLRAVKVAIAPVVEVAGIIVRVVEAGAELLAVDVMAAKVSAVAEELAIAVGLAIASAVKGDGPVEEAALWLGWTCRSCRRR